MAVFSTKTWSTDNYVKYYTIPNRSWYMYIIVYMCIICVYIYISKQLEHDENIPPSFIGLIWSTKIRKLWPLLPFNHNFHSWFCFSVIICVYIYIFPRWYSIWIFHLAIGPLHQNISVIIPSPIHIEHSHSMVPGMSFRPQHPPWFLGGVQYKWESYPLVI